MTLPTFLFGILISTLYGAAFHVLKGGGGARLLLYLVLAWTGFWAGHFIANQLNWNFGNLGALNLGMATLTSLVFLAAGYWLSLVETERK